MVAFADSYAITLNNAIGVFLCLLKTFDTVNWKFLSNAFEHFEIRTLAIISV